MSYFVYQQAGPGCHHVWGPLRAESAEEAARTLARVQGLTGYLEVWEAEHAGEWRVAPAWDATKVR